MPADDSEITSYSPEDDEFKEESWSKRNALRLVDIFWLFFHFSTLAMDFLALKASLLQRHRTAYLFGGVTQFLGNWNMCLSIAGHMLTISAMLFVEPFPNPSRYVHSERQRRESIYHWCARINGIVVPLSAVVALTHCVLLADGELAWPDKEDFVGIWFYV